MLKKIVVNPLNFRDIDEDHEEFVALLAASVAADNVGFATLFDRLLEHIELHFAREEELMACHKFAATGEHQGEHRRVLAEMRQFQRRVARGTVGFARAYVEQTLPQWLDLHVTTMDSALVAAIARDSV